jgi:ribose 5-phosphate isomerase
LGDAEVMRRSHSAEANTRGYPDPVITKDGYMILDLFFYSDFKLFGESVDYETFESTLIKIPGVVSSGLVAVPTSANKVTIASTSN